MYRLGDGAENTLSRELRRDTGKNGYRHKQATRLAQERHKNKPKMIKVTDAIRQQVDQCIVQGWSPEQIAGRLKCDCVIVASRVIGLQSSIDSFEGVRR